LLLERGFDTATVVGVIAIIGPSQVAGRIAIWGIAEQASVRTIGSVVVLVFPIALGLLLLLPPTFASLALFAVLYGAANGIFTIVRGIAVPEMLTPEAYGVINGVLAIPATIAKAGAPLAVALLWAGTGSYDAVLIAVLASSTESLKRLWSTLVLLERYFCYSKKSNMSGRKSALEVSMKAVNIKKIRHTEQYSRPQEGHPMRWDGYARRWSGGPGHRMRNSRCGRAGRVVAS
jgi:hypothetical protein